MKTTLARAAIAVSAIVSLGTPVAFAAKNQQANIGVFSLTNVSSNTTSFAISSNSLTQSGKKNSNQNGLVVGGANSTAVSNISAFSGNSVVVVQQ